MAETPENPDIPPVPPGESAQEPAEEVFESQLESIQIKLQSFEGPLDLLVHLIKKHRMNVYDIQISVITKQYLEYLNIMQELNLDLASEFLVMAATLIHIKSKMLLPRPETAAGDPGEEEDPRDMLVRRLLEHQKFKAAAELLHDKETLRNAQWARPDSRLDEMLRAAVSDPCAFWPAHSALRRHGDSRAITTPFGERSCDQAFVVARVAIIEAVCVGAVE